MEKSQCPGGGVYLVSRLTVGTVCSHVNDQMTGCAFMWTLQPLPD